MNADLTRVRRANPVPDALVVDGADLFDRITALPVDERLRRRSSALRRRPLVAIAVALVAAAVLAVAALAVSSLLGDAVRPPVTRSEYRAAQSVIPLPPGATWPTLHLENDTVTGRGGGGGYAVAIAQNRWACYWVHAIRSGDAAAGRRAQAVLLDLLKNHSIIAPDGASENWTPPNPPTPPYAVFADDGGYQWLQRSYAEAAAGHPQQLSDSCKANG